MRASGILLPVFSLPNKYGIGSFSKEAYEFVDFLKESGQKYWQILPLGPTSYGDSPYQSFSTFAGNPYFIDVEDLMDRGYVTAADLKKYSAKSGDTIDYAKLYEKRFKLLKKAYENSNIGADKKFKDFCKKNAFWLKDYALYMAVKASFDNKAWNEWDEDIRLRDAKAVKAYTEKFKSEIEYYSFLQYLFNTQWLKLKKYANKAGIEIIGDIPIYVAYDSADVWAGPELFQLDKKNLPTAVAGCPPDYFAKTGQLWGNPLYRWDYHKKTGYEWWISRIKYCFDLYDVVRIDHFRGFDEYYSIPFKDKTAEFGVWKKGPGYDLFKAINNALGERKIIAEDLGFLTDSVRDLVKKTGYPGMKITQFGFGGGPENEYLPHNLTKNSVIYPGTHDNETVRGWFERIEKTDKKSLKEFTDYTCCSDATKAADTVIRISMASVCDTCIIPLPDYLNLGNEARINIPSTLGGNWEWQAKKSYFTKKLSKEILNYTTIYGRLVKKHK